MVKIEDIRDYCVNELREVQTDNLYFGKNKGSIYWVPGAETWCYLCGDTTEWGSAEELLDYVDDSILLDYYKKYQEHINNWIKGE